MNMNVESILAVLKALHKHEVDYVLIGGLAVILQGVPRVTEDLDIFVTRDPANIARLRKALRAVFDDVSIEEIKHEELAQYPVIRYGTPANYYIDIMARVGEMFDYDDLEFETVIHNGIPIRIATKETLIKLKQGTRRQIDQADVLLLQEALSARK
jgi:hypothetical protein